MRYDHPAYFRNEWIQPTDRVVRTEVCIYGASASGVIAAVTLVRRGHRVTLLQPGGFVGGMTTGGLGWTDSGKKAAVGGMARQFYRDLGGRYGKPEEWQFEPHAADAVLQGYLDEAGIEPIFYQYLDTVDMRGQKITAATMIGGLRVEADLFIDATYEGDLLAKAGVNFTVGRESNATYGETLNGVQVRCETDDPFGDHHQFDSPVDPYRIEGDPSSGLLPGILDEDLTTRQGEGDRRIQAYNFRVCMTDDPSLKIDWVQPEGYDPADYVLLDRWLASGKSAFNEQLMHDPAYHTPIRKFDVLPMRTANGYRKTDTNNHGAVSSDFIGGNQSWPEGDYLTRERIFQDHVRWQQGLYWHIANSPTVPVRYREAYRKWGLARDEFGETGHWPHQLYVREARRMVSDHVVTEHDCLGRRRASKSIGLASYTMDSHHTARFVRVVDGRPQVLNEGNVEVGPSAPFAIDYRCVVPARGQCVNLFVPVCLSVSHIAYGSVRMEPVFMLLGESVGVAASLCLGRRCSAQDLPYPFLRSELEAAGQVLEDPAVQESAAPLVSSSPLASGTLSYEKSLQGQS